MPLAAFRRLSRFGIDKIVPPDLPDLRIGTSPRWQNVLRLVAHFARAPVPVVLLGPTGSGKTTLAAHLHRLSGRRGAFVVGSIPTIPPELRHSALQGHVRGAFTGAVGDHPGLLEQAHLGTLFLDEIGLVPVAMQEQLLAVLDGQGITRVGDVRSRQVEVRMVFATNSEPQRLVVEGSWREDFFYRLGFNWISVPGLQQRREDIVPLALDALARALARFGTPGRTTLSPDVRTLFEAHPWPGNLRELIAVCEFAALVMDGRTQLEVGDLPPVFLAEANRAGNAAGYDAHIRHVHDVLRRHAGNKSAAARELGLHRQDLYRILRRHPRQTPAEGFPREA